MRTSRKWFVTAALVVASVLLWALPPAHAAGLGNPSFELPVLPANTSSNFGAGGSGLEGWANTGAGYLINGTNIIQDYSFPYPDGQQVAELDGGHPLWQNTGIALQKMYTYTFTFYVQKNPRYPANTIYAELYTAADTSEKGSYLASQTWDLTSSNGWVQASVSVTYTGDTGSYLTVCLDLAGSWDQIAGFDAASLTVVPPHLANPSFEAPVGNLNSYQGFGVGGVPTYWNSPQNSGYLLNGTGISAETYTLPNPDGQQVVEWGTGQALWQNTGVALRNGYTYTFALYAEESDYGQTGMVVNAQLMAADDTSSSGTVFAAQSWAVKHADGWVRKSIVARYDGESGKYLTVYFGSSGRYGYWCGFDAASLSIVPPKGAIFTFR